MKIFETPPKKQKRTCLTLEQKAQIQGYALKNPKKTQEDVKAWAEDTIQGFCCNMDGSNKMDLLIIGRAAKPRCLRLQLLKDTLFSTTATKKQDDICYI
jgi:hypothetical protein